MDGAVLSLARSNTAQSNPGAASWSVDQVLGEPDTRRHGDFTTAWASKDPNGGIEWLEVDFERAVLPDSVIIHESFNPGAIIRIEALSPANRYLTIWSGSASAADDLREFAVPYSLSSPTRTLRVTLDTSIVSGWNEIDAVGLEANARTYWAVAAEASSSYSDRFPAEQPK